MLRSDIERNMPVRIIQVQNRYEVKRAGLVLLAQTNKAWMQHKKITAHTNGAYIVFIMAIVI